MDLFSSEKIIISVVTAVNDLEVISSFQFLKQSLCNLQMHAKIQNSVAKHGRFLLAFSEFAV